VIFRSSTALAFITISDLKLKTLTSSSIPSIAFSSLFPCLESSIGSLS
jgi:hypothetical protein